MKRAYIHRYYNKNCFPELREILACKACADIRRQHGDWKQCNKLTNENHYCDFCKTPIQLKKKIKTITHIDSTRLACGIQQILLDMYKKGNDPRYPIEYIGQMIMDRKDVPKHEAKHVIAQILNTGIIRLDSSLNFFTL